MINGRPIPGGEANDRGLHSVVTWQQIIITIIIAKLVKNFNVQQHYTQKRHAAVITMTL